MTVHNGFINAAEDAVSYPFEVLGSAVEGAADTAGDAAGGFAGGLMGPWFNFMLKLALIAVAGFLAIKVIA